MGNRIRLEIVWLLINWETVQARAKKKIINRSSAFRPAKIYILFYKMEVVSLHNTRLVCYLVQKLFRLFFWPCK